MPRDIRLSRRDALRLGGAAAVSTVAAGCSIGSTPKATASVAPPASTAALATPSPTAAGGATQTPSCILAPEMTEGPYYIAGETMRRDITEGKSGAILDLTITIVDAARCTPVAAVAVEIWHADASGVYSGFGSGSGNRTFLRGVQTTDASGNVTFRTIYPGWYQGRATHIHLKAHVAGGVHTTQLFFDEALNDAVYKTAAYSGHSGRRTTNNQDGIFSGGGSRTIVAVSGSGAYTGSVVLGLQQA